jgi:exopolysaccharide biosynthesis polyprenyl glycosylphosphotransferase
MTAAPTLVPKTRVQNSSRSRVPFLAQDRSRPAWQPRYQKALIISDAAVILGCMLAAQWVRRGLAHGPVPPLLWLYYTAVSLIIAATWMGFLAMYRTRSPRIIGAGSEEYRRVFAATLSFVGVTATALVILRPEVARGYLVLALPLGCCALLLSRNMWRHLIARQRMNGSCMSAVVAVGDPRAVRGLATSLARDPSHGYRVLAVCVPGGSSLTAIDVPGCPPLPILGDEDCIESAIAETGADTVALTATEHLGPDGIRDLSWRLDALGLDLLVSPGVVDVAAPRLTMWPVAGLPLIRVDRPQYSGAKRFQKRAFDIWFATLVLVVLLPLFVLVAAAIKLTSRGPVFYLSERIGLDGKPFSIIKFRSMVADADVRLETLTAFNESDGGVLFKMRCDPRVTRVGRIIRRFSIDELPQFVNVLKRQMSVVGPRPPLRREVDTYDDHVRRRLLVRPGITGLWQVSGRSDLSWEDSVRLDLSYVENWSMLNDLLIVVKTLRIVVNGAGAY